MVLGTTLSTVGSAAAVPENTNRAVNAMSRYCTTCWRNARLSPDCWPDCTQEVFSRLLERVNPDAWGQALKVEGQERKEFLRAIDTVKKRTQRRRKWSTCGEDAVADPRDAQERRLADDRETICRAATEVLSPRQQRILQMSFEGWSVQDIAAELKVPAERVSDEKYKAVRRLRSYLVGA
jgi:RNA polymerase sigma factor (sigma-70 family)